VGLVPLSLTLSAVRMPTVKANTNAATKMIVFMVIMAAPGMTRLGRTLAAGCVKSRPVVGDGGSGRFQGPSEAQSAIDGDGSMIRKKFFIRLIHLPKGLRSDNYHEQSHCCYPNNQKRQCSCVVLKPIFVQAQRSLSFAKG
jgi:hypothetical protein